MIASSRGPAGGKPGRAVTGEEAGCPCHIHSSRRERGPLHRRGGKKGSGRC